MRTYLRVCMTSGCIMAVVAAACIIYGVPFHALYSSYHAGPHIISLFSPDDAPLEHLKRLIEHETQHIRIAAYRLTDEEVSNALIHAAYRGVDVEVIADASALEARYNKVLEMLTHGITVYVFPPLSHDESDHETRVGKNALMHNKFMLFASLSTVWTGSFNFTCAARTTNQENVVIIQDMHQVARYTEHFNLLKRRSTALTHLLRATTA